MITNFKYYPSYFYSGFFIRFFAFIVDLIMIESLQRMLIFYLQPGFLKDLFALVIYLLYFILMTKLNDGQTLGKMIFGIKVIALNEEKLSWVTVVIREGFGRYLNKGLFFVMYPITIFTKYKQHPVDKLTDTSVVTINYVTLTKNIETLLIDSVCHTKLTHLKSINEKNSVILHQSDDGNLTDFEA